MNSSALFLLKKASNEGKKIVRSGYWIIGNIAFFYIIFVAIVKMLRKSFNRVPFAVRCIIMPMNKPSYMPLLPVIRILSRR